MRCACGFENEGNARFCGSCGAELIPQAYRSESLASDSAISAHSGRARFRANVRTVAIIVALAGLWAAYYFFLRKDPVRDGERAAAAFCGCARKSLSDYAAAMKGFVADFDVRRFKRQRAAREALQAKLAPVNAATEQCHKNAEARMSKLKEPYLADKAQVEKYEYALKARREGCATASETAEFDAVKADVDAKIKTIPDLEADVNGALTAEYGSKYRVVTDQDRQWDKYEFDTFVIPERKKFEYYPYIVKGDFDGDKVADLAAEVVNTENNYHRLALLWGGSRRLSFYDGQLCSALSFVPANEWKSHWEETSVTLQADAILVSCYEKSAWLLYWTGHGFQQYWMSD